MRRLLKFSYIEHYFKLITLISSIILTYALFVQYALNHKPCTVCVYQRIPYILVITFSLLGFIFEKFRRPILILNILTLIGSLILALYHFGIEQGVFSETITCANQGNIANDNSVEDIITMIYSNTAVSCKKIAYTIMGLSMAFWNIVASIGLLIYSIMTYEKKFRKLTRKS